MTCIDEQKKALRREIKILKSQLSLQEKKRISSTIFSRLESCETFQKANTIMLYWSMEDEVHTHDFVQKWATKKQIILPCVNGAHLELKIYQGTEHLVAGDRYGIPEPNGPLFTKPETIDLIVVPGVAFDRQNNRMGRGKAYYDKLLASVKAHKTGICFSFQLLETVPTDQYDIKMDEVIAG